MAAGYLRIVMVAFKEEKKIDSCFRYRQPMNQILEWLAGGDLRSDGLANEAAEAVLQTPSLFDDLYEGLSSPNDVIRGRTADALEKIGRKRPDLLVPHLEELADISVTDQVPMVKMHLAMIFGHLALYEEHIDGLCSALFDLLEDESVFARSWTIVSLCIIARVYPVECDRIINRIAPLRRDDSAAIRSRVEDALNLLTNEDAQFPKGWIKSEQMKSVADL